ncbi:MAG: peptidoglycan-binding domain-containing protein [Pauljensenia sp.]
MEDGVYGRHSRDAVTWVQRHRNLTPDGVYGPSTHNNMTWDTFGPERGCAYPHAV